MEIRKLLFLSRTNRNSRRRRCDCFRWDFFPLEGACMKRSTAVWIVSVSAFLLSAPSPAHAHLVQTGFGKFYDGATHLAITPADLLVVLALSLLAGLRGAAPSRSALILLPASWLIGGFAGFWFPTSNPLSIWMTLSFMLAGILVAADLKLSTSFLRTLICFAGLLHGYGNGSSMSTAGMGILALIGATVTVFLVITVLAAFVVSLRAAWTRIAMRVAGSWITAVGLLMLGWLTRGR